MEIAAICTHLRYDRSMTLSTALRIACIFVLSTLAGCSRGPTAVAARPPLTTAKGPTAKAVLGAGCFWCVEAMYEQIPGVVNVISGYAGGPEANPTYEAVGAGRTGHAEVVEIEYDPTVVTYGALLDFFWKTHDPTDGRGVAPDFGPQYRSIILYGNDEERGVAESAREAEGRRLKQPIATQLVKLERFYPAEEYHQDYVWRNPGQGYVRAIAIPKLKKLGLKTP